MARPNRTAPPLERLGRWDGNQFVPVVESSIDADRVHVLTHGWARGLGSVVAATDDLLRAWDEEAVTPRGGRFDTWFGPLGTAIVEDDPEAEVLAFSWVDDSATAQNAMTSLRSQLRTTVNGQRMAEAIRQALGGVEQSVHLVGFSHGAKVATVAAVLSQPPPQHLTILDSPDNLVPILGGALNDLTSYLRLIAPGGPTNSTFVDNYPSHFGVQYGRAEGLGGVVDVTLDPTAHPILGPPNDHAYAWAWYLGSAQDPSQGVGYAWSPLRDRSVSPSATQMRQSAAGPFDLETNPGVLPGTAGSRLRTRAEKEIDKETVLSTDGKTKAYGFFWRRSGDLWASAPVNWRHGPDDASVSVRANRTERARTVKGWSPDGERVLHLPLGGARAGPMLIKVELESSAPAEVSFRSAKAVNGFVLPGGSELQAWIRPSFFFSLAVIFFTIGWLGRRGFRGLKDER